MKVLWLAIMMAAPALGAYSTWTECTDDKVKNCDCTFECYDEGKEVKICQCDCQYGSPSSGKAKFWYDCEGPDSESCKDSDDCKESSDDCKKDRLYESQEEDCRKKDDEDDCESCCKVTCKKYHDPTKCSYWYDDCVDDCIEDAPCDKAGGGGGSKKCRKDRLWEWQEKNCKKKSSESSCENCCEDYCDLYHDKDDNSCHYWDDCVDDCIEDAPCDEAGDSSDGCDFLSYYQYKRCGDKSSKSKCKNCCWDECGDENPNSSRCRDKCYYEAKSDADCSNAGDDDDDDRNCSNREDDCCDCVDRCVRKKKGWKKEKICIKNKCKSHCKDGAECSGDSRDEWKDYVEDKCDFHY